MALFTAIAIAVVANGVKTLFVAFGVPDPYALVLGFAVVTPILVYSISVSGNLQTEAYRRNRGVRGVSLDALVVVLSAMVGGSLGTSITLLLLAAGSWQQAIGVSLAVLAGREAFVHRNRSYFEDGTNPWVAAKLGERIEKRDG